MSKDSMTEVDTLQQERRSIPEVLQTVTNFIKWLAALIKFTEEEREVAGIYRDHPGGE
jgi:hypothetical protein